MVVIGWVLGERTEILLVDEVDIDCVEDATYYMTVENDPVYNLHDDVDLVDPVDPTHHVEHQLFQVQNVQ